MSGHFGGYLRWAVKHLMIVPNAINSQGSRLLTNDAQEFQPVIEKYGYQLIAKDPKYHDPIVQQYAIDPTYCYLFELK